MSTIDRIGKTTNEAVIKNTGKPWDKWIEIIDREGGAKMTHKEIARMLADKNYINSSWWCQAVTVGYEYAKGRRVVGKTADAGFEVGVQKVIYAPQGKLWQFINSPRGKRIWQKDALVKVRTKKEGERLRMSYTRRDWKDESVLQITLMSNPKTPNKTNLNFHQEKLKNSRQRNVMRKHWREVLEQIEKSI